MTHNQESGTRNLKFDASSYKFLVINTGRKKMADNIYNTRRQLKAQSTNKTLHHTHASFSCCVLFGEKKPVPKKTCARKHDTYSRNRCKFLQQVSGTRLWSMCVNPIMLLLLHCTLKHIQIPRRLMITLPSEYS